MAMLLLHTQIPKYRSKRGRINDITKYSTISLYQHTNTLLCFSVVLFSCAYFFMLKKEIPTALHSLLGLMFVYRYIHFKSIYACI
uniref:Uncharacterized protein n=1 Tax=Octopus bimaculoides TaxID=37653 RepID=A0A0L8HNY8_OCTBM